MSYEVWFGTPNLMEKVESDTSTITKMRTAAKAKLKPLRDHAARYDTAKVDELRSIVEEIDYVTDSSFKGSSKLAWQIEIYPLPNPVRLEIRSNR